MRALAESLAGIPVLPGARQTLEAQWALRGARAAQALAGGAFALERAGDGPVRAVQAAAGDDPDGDRDAAAYEGLVSRFAADIRGGMDLSRALALRDAFTRGGRGVSPGHGRDAPVAGGDAHGPAAAGGDESLIGAFLDWFDGPGMAGEEPAVRAALAHYHLSALRPLSPAYGPAARLAETVLLVRAGFGGAARLMAEYYLRHAGAYAVLCPVHPVLRGDGGAGEDDPTPFVALCLDALAFGLREVGRRVAGVLRRMVLERHYEELRQARRLTARQHALLRLLLDAGHVPVGIRRLCRDSPFRLLYGRASEQTARRDLKRLSGMGLLAAAEGGFVLDSGGLGV